MNKADIRNKLCRNFCKYYKPSKKEEFACIGFLAIERLIGRGKRIPFRAFKERMHLLTQEVLIKNLCVLCPFYEDDCDFVRQKGAPPCGGFLLLGHLLETKAISIDNIRDSG